MRFATLVDNKRDVRDDILENCQARYRSNTWMGRTHTDGPDEFEPTKFDCICISLTGLPINKKALRLSRYTFSLASDQTEEGFGIILRTHDFFYFLVPGSGRFLSLLPS